MVVFLVLVSGLISLVVFPQSLFANKLEHEKFLVYYNNPIEEDKLRLILNDAYQLVERCELHDSDYRFDIFLADGNLFNQIDDLQGKGPSARATAGNIIIKVPIDAELNLAHSPISRINLTELIAHEMVHLLQAHTYGLINFSPVKHPPMWKLEGYPEYVARESRRRPNAYDLIAEIERFLALEQMSPNGFHEVVEGHFMPAYYLKGRLMIEYLMDVRSMTYDSILKDTRSEDEIFNEMLHWMKSQPSENPVY